MPSVAPSIGELPKKLPELPGAEAEAKAIASVFQTQPIIGASATKPSSPYLAICFLTGV